MRTSVALLALLMLVLSTVPAGSAFHDALPDYPNKFGWSVPANHTGDILVEVGVDYGDDNACLIYGGAAGRSTQTGLHRIAMGDRGGWSASSGGSTLTYTAQAHGGDIDTRDLTKSSGQRWASQGWRWGSGFHGAETWTFAAFDTGAAFDTESWSFSNEILVPFALEISCEDSFTVSSLAGSTSVIGFDPRTMEGTGASTSVPSVLDAAVNGQDGLNGSFDTEETVFAVRGFQINGASAAQVTVDHPGGTTRGLLTTLDPDMDLRGPGGDYAFRVDRAGAAQADIFWGILGGLDTVDDLDELLG